jgi:hypothetical protein
LEVSSEETRSPNFSGASRGRQMITDPSESRQGSGEFNLLLNVRAKDKGTGKEQQIDIQASSGLVQGRIKRMGKDAKEAKNHAEALVHLLDKVLAEQASKVGKEGPSGGSQAKAIFVPDYLRSNSYRVLRLSANSNYSEIHKASASMKRAAKLGLASTTEADMPLLGEISRTEAEIQRAIARINDPSQRLRDRLFWFYLTPKLLDAQTTSRLIETFQDNPEAAAALSHDKALHVLLAALSSSLDDAGIQLWVRALRAWHQVVSDDSYWSLTLALEDRGAFEPPALPSEIDALRDNAVQLAAEAFVVAARAALAGNELSTVRRTLDALQELAETGPWAASAQEDIISPAIEQFQKLCDVIRQECSNKIVREDDTSARSNKNICDEALRRFRAEIEPALDRLVQLIPQDHHSIQQSRVEAARCLHNIAVNLTWADDFAGSEKLHEDALKLAGDTATAIEIEGGLAQVREVARKQRILGALKPISSAPALSTINGFGFTVYGNSDYDGETRSYVTTHYFVALFIPVFPIARYRVINEGDRYRFLGKLPLRAADRWHLWIAITAIFAVILGSIITSGKGSHASPSTVRSDSAPGWTSSPSSPPSSAASSRTSQLSNLKAQIDAGRSRYAVLEKQLQPVIDELTSLDERIKRLKTELSSLDERQKLQGSIDIASYNARVDIHNGLIAKRRALFYANSADLKTLVDLGNQESALVNQYNALLKR